MPPRKRSRPVSTYNANTFVSEAASIRYNEYNRKRLAIPERGIDVPGHINEEIEKRDWEFLCGDPALAIAPLIMEVLHQSLLQLAQKEDNMPVVLPPLQPYPIPPAVDPPSESD